MRKALVEKHSKIRAYDSNYCFGAKLPSLTLMNAENILPNSLPDGFAVQKGMPLWLTIGDSQILPKKTNSNDGPGSYQLFKCWLFLLPYVWENATYKNTTEKRLKKSNLQNCRKMRVKKMHLWKK